MFDTAYADPGTDVSAEMALARVEELRIAVHYLAVQHGQQAIGSITISAGIAAMPEHGVTPDVLIEAADRALYATKKAGRDHAVSAPARGAAKMTNPHSEPVVR
jgi:diguanylate cyclase (GGDEF)-like protein